MPACLPHDQGPDIGQIDYNQPERFGLEYTGEDGAKHRPVMVHRGLLSSMERMTALLIERYDGRMPTWLAPVQVAILPVSAARHGQEAGVFAKQLEAAGLRIKVCSEGTLGNRIREARNHRDCYIAVLGDAEIAAGTVNIVSSVDKGTLTIEDFVSWISVEIRNRSRVPEVLLEP